MANDFDIPPLQDILINKKTITLSDVWNGWFSFFYQTITSYLTQNGIFVPTLTEDQINALPLPKVGKALGTFINTSGQMVYDITNNVPKIFVIALDSDGIVTSASWKTFTIT